MVYLVGHVMNANSVTKWKVTKGTITTTYNDRSDAKEVKPRGGVTNFASNTVANIPQVCCAD